MKDYFYVSMMLCFFEGVMWSFAADMVNMNHFGYRFGTSMFGILFGTVIWHLGSK